MDKKGDPISLRLKNSRVELFQYLLMLTDKKPSELFDEAIENLFYDRARVHPAFRKKFIEVLQKDQANNGHTE